MFKFNLLSVTIAISLASTSPNVYSLGIINNTHKGILNRPLNLELQLIAESFELYDLHVSLADDQQHEKFGLIYPTWMPKLNFETINSQQGPALKVTSIQPIKEPIVNFVLQIKYKEMILFKEITLFLDPVEIFNSDLNTTKNSNSPQTQTVSIAPKATIDQNNQSNNSDASIISFRVERGQNLWNIAKNWDIANADINQKMQAIFLSNQDAFIRGDKNKLKQGSQISFSIESLKLVTNLTQSSLAKTLMSEEQVKNSVTNNTSEELEKTQSQQNNLKTDLSTSSNASLSQQPNNLSSSTLQLEHELLILKDTISQQQELNFNLRAELERLEKQIELKAQLILAENKTNQTLQKFVPNTLIETEDAKPAETIKIESPATQRIPITINTDNLTTSTVSNNIEENSPMNLWLTAIWFGLALTLAYLGTILSGKRNAKKFARKLDDKLQDLAYNKQKQLSQTPSIKELSIPDNLSPSVQIKYLNSAADFYIRCHRHDLAKELVNEGLLQFKGNPLVIDTLNQIRKRIFSHLDNDIHTHIVEKLDARALSQKQNNEDETENIIDIDDFNKEWLKQWDKKVS